MHIIRTQGKIKDVCAVHGFCHSETEKWRLVMKKKRRRKKKNYNRLFFVVTFGVLIVAGFIYIAFIKEDSDKDSTQKSTTVEVENKSTTDIDAATKNTENATDENTTDENTTSEAETNNSGQQTTKVSFENFAITDEIKSLPTEVISLGYSRENTERDEYNRPVMIENIQQQYGDKYNSVFIGDENSKKIYLTFTMGYEYYNDGVANTDVIMNILKEKNVPAMFFVDGGYVRNCPEMCKKIVENGFILGCHGYDHPSDGVATLPIEDQLEDAKKIYNAIYEVTGVEPYYYRFGSGIWNERALALLSELGFINVFYSLTYYDYDTSNQPDEAETLQMMIDNIHSGEIIYLHTVSNTSVAILDDFIDAAREKGYEFGIVYEENN